MKEGTALLLDFAVPKETLKELVQEFLLEMENSLKITNGTASMLDSHLATLPEGTETGTFLTLDVGGTNIRVCSVTLNGNRTSTSRHTIVKISQEKKTGTGVELFDYIADCVGKALPEIGVETGETQTPLPLAFTFSFPIQQRSVETGTVLSLSKGFTCTDLVGKNVVTMLQTALNRKKLPINVVCLLNDAVGTLLSAAYKRREVIAGVVIGTGTNSAYFDKHKKTIINTEWAVFCPEKLPRTSLDRKLDENSLNQGLHLYEKMISGKYLGEQLRLALLDNSETFTGPLNIPKTPFTIDTEEMSRFFAHNTIQEQQQERIFGIQLTASNQNKIRIICEAIYTRSASLLAVGIAALYKRVNEPKNKRINISIDGSIYSKISRYSSIVDSFISELLPGDFHNIDITEEADGSSIGGAVAAAIAKSVTTRTKTEEIK